MHRLSTWKSLRVLDTIVNSILGRADGLPGIHHDPRLRRVGQTCSSSDHAREIALQATFDICPLMDELEQKKCNQDTTSSEAFLQSLQHWSKALPQELRRSTGTSSPTPVSDRELYIGGVHVACVYYFAVILTTRRFFTMHLLDQIKERASSTTSSTSKVDEKASSLAYVCLNAAVTLAKVGYDAMTSGQMLSNMCLLK